MMTEYQVPHSTERMVEAVDPSDVSLPLLSSTEDFSNEAIFINPLTPPLHILPSVDPQHWAEPESKASSENVGTPEKTSDRVSVGEEDPLLVPEAAAMATQGINMLPHECPLCTKVFGTTNALNKHLLTHQANRPHVCSICQRAFKRHDHLTGHMLTHQKKKPFCCTHPGCEKSYCDSHSLKRHCASQHGVFLIPPAAQSTPSNPSHSSAVQWEPADSAACLGGPAGHDGYHSPFLSQPKSDTQHEGSSYSGFAGSYSSYPGFATLVSGLGVNRFPEDDPPQVKPLLVQDPWSRGAAKDPCGTESTDELAPSQGVLGCSQWAPPSGVSAGPVAPQSSGGVEESLGVHCWESSLDFPVSELQTLEEILSFQPCRETAGARVDRMVKPACPESSTRPRQHHRPILLKHTFRQDKREEKPQPQNPYRAFGSLSTSARPESSATRADLVPVALPSHYRMRLSDPPDPPPPPPKGENRRKRARKKTAKANDVPAPPLPAPHPTSMFAPRRPRPRPVYLVSPSQVAMASFSSESGPCPPSKGGDVAALSMTGDRREAADRAYLRYPPVRSEQFWAPIPQAPSEITVKIEPSSPELSPSNQQGGRADGTFGQSQGAQTSPCRSDQMLLSPLVIPVSVPVSGRTDSNLGNQAGEHGISPSSLLQNHKVSSKRTRRLELLKTLIIPNPPPPPQTSPCCGYRQEGVVGGQWCRAAGGYSSHLRSPMYLADHLLNPCFQPPPYTPPPMLSPLRPGTGLYFNTLPPPLHPCPPPPSTYTATLDGTDGISLVMDDTVVKIEPRINVGSRFQAEIPPLRNLLLMLSDEHPAQLVWAPWGDISSSVDTQHRVTELLDMCCSSVLPGGGTNTELALHCLHEVQGDILAALDLLLIRGDYRSSSHPLSNYHYTGSDHWSAQEKRLFRKGLVSHDKDFQLIQSVLQSKSMSQCVEYYYAMKKLKKFKQRNRGADKKEGAGADSIESPNGPEEHPVGRRGARRSLTRRRGTTQGAQPATGTALEYTCEECGRGFEKVKSRSAHMKTHRQQEREWSAMDGWSSGEMGQGDGQLDGSWSFEINS